MVRWAWRLFRREWRQQLLILALVVVAVAATIIGAAVSTDTRQPANFGFGTAQDSATFHGSSAQVTDQVAKLQHRFGTVEVIDNETLPIPGSINTYQLRVPRVLTDPSASRCSRCSPGTTRPGRMRSQ